MPGRQVQLDTTIEQLTKKLKPIWIKDNTTQTVADSLLSWDHFKKLIINKAEELVQGVPDRPYIQFTNPTQAPDKRTTNQTVAQQQQELIKINEERKAQGLASIHVTNPYEYAALQQRFTQRVQKEAGQSLTTLNPIDSQTWTRFINLPLSADRDVPDADFSPDDRQFLFVRGNADLPYSISGFRLSVRVTI